MNIQYNQDLDIPNITVSEDDSEISEESGYKEMQNLKISTKLAEKTTRASSRLN